MRLPKLFVGPFIELKRPAFPVDDELVKRQIAEAALHPVNGIKRLLVEETPTRSYPPSSFPKTTTRRLGEP